MKLFFNDVVVATFNEKTNELKFKKSFSDISWQAEDLSALGTFIVRAENAFMGLNVRDELPDVKIYTP